MGNIGDTLEDRIQNAILTAIDSIITLETESAKTLINVSSGRGATSVIATSDRGEHIVIIAPFGNVSERNITPHVFNTNDETPGEVSELSVPGTHFDRQPHTHHSNIQDHTKFLCSSTGG